MKNLLCIFLLVAALFAPALAIEDINKPGEPCNPRAHFVEGKKTMVFYYARWDKTANRLQVELADFDKTDDDWTILRVNVKNLNSKVAKQHGIKNVPVFELYDEKGQLMAQGTTAYSEVLKMLESR